MSKITFEKVEAAVHPKQFKKPDGDDGGAAYNNAATWGAKCLLAAARRDPIAFGAAMDVYRKDPHTDAFDGLLLPDERDEIGGFSGFMWGWAVQACAYLLEQAPVPNGAVLIIGGPR